jgi:ribosomal-protein-alanine N-acetyltransferase
VTAISTRRLELVPATYEHCAAEVRDTAELAALLGADVPADWPPPLNDEHSQRFFLETLRDRPESVGWCVWYFIAHVGARTVIGNGGFKGEPQDGTVEVGYSIIPAFQRRGYASEAVAALVEWAFSDARVNRVIAETLPELSASIGVLRRTGFRSCDGASEPGNVRFERIRGARTAPSTSSG